MTEDDRVRIKSPDLWADVELAAGQQVRIGGVGIVVGADERIGNDGKTWTRFGVLLDGVEIEILAQPPEPVSSRVTVPPE
jgi:hypothetical protein